jgi:uncharacterized protein YjbI with pentapeptide repeats
MPHPVNGAVPPRLPRTLPEVADLVLVDDAEWSGAEVSGDFSAQAAARVEVRECPLAGAVLTGANLAGARVIDVVFASCEVSGAAWPEAVFRRVEFRQCRLLGASFAQAQLNDVRFTDCRMDGSDFRMSTGQRVEFSDCRLPRADFYAAKLSGARLFDCDLTGAEFSRVRRDLAGRRRVRWGAGSPPAQCWVAKPWWYIRTAPSRPTLSR